MDTNNKNSNSNDEAMDTQTAPPEATSGKVEEAVRQMQASFSSFFQEDQRKDENLSRQMDLPSDQIRILGQKIEEIWQQIKRILELIRNYRS
jgi:Tfp pilus assembly PilM family ATPase